MSAVPDDVSRPLSERDTRALLGDLERRQQQGLRQTRAGIAAVCAAIFPGLGHLFQMRIGAAIFFALAAGILGYQAAKALTTDGSVLWAVAALALWIINIYHAASSVFEPDA